MESKRGVIVFSGFNQRAVFAFLRTVDKCNVPYAIIAKSGRDTILLSRYRSRVLAIRAFENLVLDDILCGIDKVNRQTGWTASVMAPTSEGLNRFVLEHRSSFERKGMIIPLVEGGLYKNISDKYSFSRLCKEASMDVPEEYPSPVDINTRFVAKPKTYFNKVGVALSPILVLTDEDKQAFLSRYNPDDFYYQEYVGGESLYLLYYFDRSGNVYKYSQKNLAQQGGGKSIIAAVSSDVHDSELSSSYEHLFLGQKYFGFVMVEIRKSGDKSYMIEANPRFWGPSQLFVDARKNFFEAFLRDYGLIDDCKGFVQGPVNGIRYFWYGGMVQMFREKKDVVCHAAGVDLEKGLHSWLLHDVYLRDDTLSVFKSELV